jgi:hypothetical protein
MIALWRDNDANKALDLYPDASISLEYNNPLFGTIGDLGKTYTYPFKVPRTPKNEVDLDFPNYLKTTAWVRPKYTLVYQGVALFMGEVIIRSASNDYIEINFSVNRREAWIFDTKMTELFLGYKFQQVNESVQTIGMILYASMATNFVVTKGAACVINGKIYESGLLNGTIPDVLNALATVINANSSQTNCTASVVGGLVPTTISSLVLERIDAIAEFWAYPFVNYYDLKNNKNEYNLFFIYGSYSTDHWNFLDDEGKAFIDEVMSNPDNYDYLYPEIILLPKQDSDYRHPLNRHEGGEYSTDDDASVVSPQLKLLPALQRICEYNNFSLNTDFFSQNKFAHLLIINNHSNITDGFLNAITYHEQLFFFAHKYPNMTFAEFLEALQKMFCLYISFDFGKRELIIRSAGDILADNELQEIRPQDTAEVYTIEEYPYQREGFNFKLAKPAVNSNYKRFATQNQQFYREFKVEPAKRNIDTKLTIPSPIYSQNGTNYQATNQESVFVGLWGNLPQQDQIIYGFGYADVPTSPTDFIWNQWTPFNGLSFYRGFVDGKPVTVNTTDEVVLSWGDVTQKIDGREVWQKGLYSEYWQKWVNFLQSTQVVKRFLYLDIVQLSQLRLDKKIRVDNQTFLIKKLRVGLTNKGIKPAEAELLSVF